MKEYRITWMNVSNGKIGHSAWQSSIEKVKKEKRHLEKYMRGPHYCIEEQNIFWRNFWRKFRKFLPIKSREKNFVYYLSKTSRKRLGLTSMTKKCLNCFAVGV